MMKICPKCSRRFPENATYCPEDGSELVNMLDVSEIPEDDLTGMRLFGDYLIKKKLGEGGMGAVYLAENPSIGQRIAVKVLHGRAAQSDELVKRFNREAKAICRLTHPNIIRVFIFGHTEDGLIYLAMEFVEGRSLREYIEEHGALKEASAINIMRQALHALAEAHELGIIHRDLKPDNIMLTRFRGVDDYVKVLDFGIAKVKEPDGKPQQKLTQAGVVYGTPEYLSPEQAQAKELDGRSDLYSMGIILYEMLTGDVPFDAPTAVAILAAHVYDDPRPPSQVAKRAIHPKMERIILKAISKKVDDRYQSAMEFLADLEEVESELIGDAATRTAMLDPRHVSVLLEAAKRSSGKGDGASPKLPGGPAAQRAGNRPSNPGRASAPARANPAKNAPAPSGTAAMTTTGSSNKTLLYTIIAGLVLLLVMALVTLFVVAKKQKGQQETSLPAPPAIERLAQLDSGATDHVGTSARRLAQPCADHPRRFAISVNIRALASIPR